MSWNVRYLPEALEDLRKLDGSQKILIRKAIQKVCQNPLPESEGGYGKLLGNKNNTNLSGFVTYSHHLTTFEVGASRSIALSGKA